MAEVKTKKSSFIDMGKLLIRTTPENLNGFFLTNTSVDECSSFVLSF